MVELACALDLLSTALGEEALARVARTEVRRDGALIFTLEGASEPQWVCVSNEGSRVKFLRPEDDSRLPLARRLPELLGSEGGEILSWRAGRRLVLACETQHGRRVVKGFRRGRLDGALDSWRVLPSGAAHGFHIAKVLEYSEEDSALSTTFVEGEPLAWDGPESPLESVGAALRDMQQTEAFGLELHDRRAELDVLERFVRKLRSVEAPIEPCWFRARERVAELARQLPPRRATLAHRDLHDGQLLRRGHDLVLLDLDTLTRAEAELDAGNLLAHFELRRLQGLGGADAVDGDTPRRDFLRGWLGVESTESAHLAWYEATTFLRLALLYRLRPRWSHLHSSLIHLADERLHAAPRP